MPFTLKCVQSMGTSVYKTIIHQYMFGVKKLFTVESVLLRRNNLATASTVFFAPGIQKLVDRRGKCLTEFGRYVETEKKTITSDI